MLLGSSPWSCARRACAALACALALVAGPAFADDLSLRWNECPEGGGLAQRTSGCGNPLAVEHLVTSLQLSAPVDSVVAIEMVVDLVSSSATLPDWWQFGSGGCNSGALSASADFSALGACSDPFSGTGVAVVQTWFVTQPRGGANMARMIVTTSVLASQQTTIGAGAPYYGADIRMTHARSSGASACAGCATAVCLVFNSAQLIRHPAAVPAEVTVLPSGASNTAAWQGNFSNCSLVPARNTTWGAIKSLYR
ncbi:MAG: hypothetical protein HZA61_15760 [Candidatus Eisenbacteria bacterium]|uniref:Uncharacterized protein n=1 Tax=Eiseniibacteriota bacterium TaxID=2212470 RepID=A0A933SGL7_UNCEI|nr:hypothetical protein [Candidatus Eisenbacteria bacterium]